MSDRIGQLVRQYRKNFAEHELTVVTETPEVTVVWLRKPGTGIYSAQIAFLPRGISISGDVCFHSEHAVFCDFKTLGWFSGQLSADYLTEKFRLRRTWNGEEARAEVADWIRQCRPVLLDEDDGRLDTRELENIHNLRCLLRDPCLDWDDPNEVYDATVEWGEPPEATVAHPAAVAMLVVVQETFARLWAERVGRVAA